MNDPLGFGQGSDPRVGLCARCAHARIVRTARGSEFYRCELSFSDPRFPRYPSLPVLRCDGYRQGIPVEPC